VAYQIRKISEDGMREVWEWAMKEGWNPGLYDSKIFPAIDPHGCFVGVLNGMVISSTTAIQYEGKYGFGGMYIVKPEYRGQGYGLASAQHAMKYLAGVGVECIGCDAVPDKVPIYQRLGLYPAYRITRYKYTIHKEYQGVCRGIEKSQLDAIVEYDLKVSKVTRQPLLKDLLWNCRSVSCAEYKDERLVGFAIARPAYEGYRVGPCFADSADIARRLLETIFARLKGQTIFIDVPEVNAPAISLVETYGIELGFACIRMYNTTSRYNQDVQYVFGNTTFEVG
jgi:GNAT superfamily N-acetyltransferase